MKWSWWMMVIKSLDVPPVAVMNMVWITLFRQTSARHPSSVFFLPPTFSSSARNVTCPKHPVFRTTWLRGNAAVSWYHRKQEGYSTSEKSCAFVLLFWSSLDIYDDRVLWKGCLRSLMCKVLQGHHPSLQLMHSKLPFSADRMVCCLQCTYILHFTWVRHPICKCTVI